MEIKNIYTLFTYLKLFFSVSTLSKEDTSTSFSYTFLLSYNNYKVFIFTILITPIKLKILLSYINL